MEPECGNIRHVHKTITEISNTPTKLYFLRGHCIDMFVQTVYNYSNGIQNVEIMNSNTLCSKKSLEKIHFRAETVLWVLSSSMPWDPIGLRSAPCGVM